MPAVCDTEAGILLAQRANDRFDRQRTEAGRRAISYDRLIDRLLAFIVGDPRIIDIDRYTFDGNIDTAAGLSDGNRQPR